MKENRYISSRQAGRIDYIDGIRGVCAIIVLICHLVDVFLPEWNGIVEYRNRVEQLYYGSPLHFLSDGSFAVCFFFVLSGYLITRKVYINNRIVISPIKTYIKLYHIIVPAVLFSALLMATHQMYHIEASRVDPQLSFVLDYNSFNPTVKSVIKDVFFNSFFLSSIYVGPFWTIKYEFINTLIMMLIAFYAFRCKNRQFVFLFSFILSFFWSQYLPSFFAGAIVFDLSICNNTNNQRISQCISKLKRNKVGKVVCAFILLFGLYLALCNSSFSGIWIPLQILKSISFFTVAKIKTLGILLAFLYISVFDWPKKLLNNKITVWLGRISPFIYAFHWPIILSVGCGVYLLLYNTVLNYYVLVVLISVIVVLTTMFISIIVNNCSIIIIKKEKKLIDYLKKKIYNRQ